MKVTYLAHSNIALAKYWGKSDRENNLPSTPSASMTLDALFTKTTVDFGNNHSLTIDGQDATSERFRKVAQALCDEAGSIEKIEATSVSNFPVASGLASSASGFAAFIAAGSTLLGLSTDHASLAERARRASASAARSIHGGFVALYQDGRTEEIATDWNPAMVIAITTSDRKRVSSTEAMLQTQSTSPLYETWKRQAPNFFEEVKRGIELSDLSRVGRAMEASTLLFHASAMNAEPPIYYWNERTLRILKLVATLRSEGMLAFSTMDAGPHVKILCSHDDASSITDAIANEELAVDTIISSVGRAAAKLHP